MTKHSVAEYTADGEQTQWAINFTGGYISEDDVTVRVNDETLLGDPVYRPFIFINAGLVEIQDEVGDPDPLTDGDKIVIARKTDVSEPVHEFNASGATLSREALDENFEQVLFGVQEAQDRTEDIIVSEDAAERAVAAAERAEEAADILEDIAGSGIVRGVYNFSGTGTRDGITLPIAPVSKNAVTVTVGGAVLPRNAFTLAGQVLTPLAPINWPVGTDNIEVAIEGNLPTANVVAAFTTRTSLRNFLATFSGPDGAVFEAEDLRYAWSLGSTSIPDIPNAVPLGVAAPEHFGDGNAAWVAWGAHVNTVGFGRLLNATYAPTSPIVFTRSVNIHAEGATINVGVDTSVSLFEFNGGNETRYPLTASVNAGATSARISPENLTSSGISVGDYVRLLSDETLDPGRTNSMIGEIIRVRSVNTTTGEVTFGYPAQGPNPLTEGLFFGYSTTDSAQMSKCNIIYDVSLTGVCHMVASETPSDSQVGIEMISCFAPLIESGWTGERFGGRWLWLRSCIQVELPPRTLRGFLAHTTGYGVSVADGSRDVVIRGLHGEFIRHLFSTNNTSATGNIVGIPRDITVDGFAAINSSPSTSGSGVGGDAMDTHAAAVNVTFKNGVIENPSGQAINVECANVIIENVELRGPVPQNQAIQIRNYTKLDSWYVVRNITWHGGYGCAGGVVRCRNVGSGSIESLLVEGLNVDVATGRVLWVDGVENVTVNNITANRAGLPTISSFYFNDCDRVFIDGVRGKAGNDTPMIRVDLARVVHAKNVTPRTFNGQQQPVIEIRDNNTGTLNQVLVNGCAGIVDSGETTTGYLIRIAQATGNPDTVIPTVTNAFADLGGLLAP